MSQINIFLVLLMLTIFKFVYAAGGIEFNSHAAEEYQVSFSALVSSNLQTVEEVQNMSLYDKQEFINFTLKPTAKYLFGPLTNRSLGGEQKGFKIDVRWDEAYVDANGVVMIPYDYSGQWLVAKTVNPADTTFSIPLPYTLHTLQTTDWLNCTDSAPEHQTQSFFWYFWDPNRSGCDHQLGVHYQIIQPKLSAKTEQTVLTYPEYKNMIHNNKISMTFGFGYVEDPSDPDPMTDSDYGVRQFRDFINVAQKSLKKYKVQASDILESEYQGVIKSERKIGTRLEFVKDGINYEVKIVVAVSIDQMEVFAKSFAHDHDAFFGWFGHSRVGSGFDASRFKQIVRDDSSFYNITPNYQLIYWAGCNSYSYYTLPFFEAKANLLPNDTNGTKSLDIISNGLPSLFSLNSDNAEIMLKKMITPNEPTSFQTIIEEIENTARQSGVDVLVNVLGDEDNEAL